MKLRDILIALSSFVFMSAANALPVFAQLEAHESIRIEVKSMGCFHNSQTVYEFNQAWVAISEVISDGTKDLGRVKLSPIDIANLDKLMGFYSGELEQGCTTSNSITIQEVSDGKVTNTQTVVDGSCSLDHSKYLTFYELKERLNNPLKNEV